MSDISTIRALISDLPLIVQEACVLDGTQLSARAVYYPIIDTSVILTPTAVPDSIDGQSGLLKWDTAPTGGTYTLEYQSVYLVDSTIQSILNLQSGGGIVDGAMLRFAAANCLEAIASSQALILKRITLLDLQTDGPSLADSLRKHAEALRSSDQDEPCFDIIEQINDYFGYREKVVKDWLREDL